jgi:signal transduction histidine kinase
MTTKESGTGLGLYVSYLFVQSLGGELKVKNLSPGAQVTLTWPDGVSHA